MKGDTTDVEVVPAVETEEGAGALVRRMFPTGLMRDYDPFALLDEFDLRPPAGFPEHPHRGFEALTYMLEGSFHHRDDMGNDSTVAAGGAQRFTAGGRGIVHSEMPGSKGRNRGLQLWVKLQARLKGVAPSYQQVDAPSIPEAVGDGFRARIVVGEGSPVRLSAPVRYLDVLLDAWATFEDEVPEGWRGLVYVLDGRVTVGGAEVRSGSAAMLAPGSRPTVSALEGGARFVLLLGKPLGEPIIHRGPFVE
jgi:redox-sensitive bicupin YhaK (pirin superfamily)